MRFVPATPALVSIAASCAARINRAVAPEATGVILNSARTPADAAMSATIASLRLDHTKQTLRKLVVSPR